MDNEQLNSRGKVHVEPRGALRGRETALWYPNEDRLEVRPLFGGGIQGPIAVTMGNGWRLELRDDIRRSFMSYRPNPFPGLLINSWFYHCVNDLPWDRPWVNEKPLNRKACWLTLPGVSKPYKYGGMEWSCRDMPGWFQLITAQVMQVCGVTQPPNSCNANLYEDGDDVVGWHADDEPLFKATLQDALIISLSLGTKRTFAYRLNTQPNHEHKITLGDGDLCTMEGMMQKYYKHAILKQKGETQARINLTWRWIVA